MTKLLHMKRISQAEAQDPVVVEVAGAGTRRSQLTDALTSAAGASENSDGEALSSSDEEDGGYLDDDHDDDTPKKRTQRLPKDAPPPQLTSVSLNAPQQDGEEATKLFEKVGQSISSGSLAALASQPTAAAAAESPMEAEEEEGK